MPMQQQDGTFEIGRSTERFHHEVVRLRNRDTTEILAMAADVVAAPGEHLELERNALALVLREKAGARR